MSQDYHMSKKLPLHCKLNYVIMHQLLKYRVTHKGCDFNGDCRAFIHSYLSKLCALQQLPDCIVACNIIYKRLQGAFKSADRNIFKFSWFWRVLCRRWSRILCGKPCNIFNLQVWRNGSTMFGVMTSQQPTTWNNREFQGNTISLFFKSLFEEKKWFCFIV